MKNQIDQYDFSQSSGYTQEGFVSFFSEKNNAHYFHFNDKSGKALLFSQAYTGERGRDNGLKSVKKNIANAERIFESKANGKFYFTIRAGNNQEIARSRVFNTKAELSATLKYLMEFTTPKKSSTKKQKSTAVEIKGRGLVEPKKASIEKMLPKLQQKREAYIESISAVQNLLKRERGVAEQLQQQINKTLEPTPTDMSDLSVGESGLNKSSFRIDVYKTDTEELIQGRIEHLLTQNKQAFQGTYDQVDIFNFIKKHLPWSQKELVTDTASASTKKLVVETENRGIEKAARGTLSITVPTGEMASAMSGGPTTMGSEQMVASRVPVVIGLSTNTETLSATYLERGQSAESLINIQEEKLKEADVVKVNVYAYAIDRNESQMVASIVMQLDDKMQVRTPLMVQNLPEGTYRLRAKIFELSQDTSTEALAQANTMLHVYS